MKYFKNTELAKIYNVSEKTVRNWIVAAQEGKLDLQLFEEKGKAWVANTIKNTRIIEEQVDKGKKYRNSRGFRVTTPSEEFYENYDQKQILDIVSSLTIQREIPLQYCYVDGGASYWDSYANRLYRDETPNVLTSTIKLLGRSAEYIDDLIKNKRKINVVDLGPGNGLPIKSTLERLLEKGALGRYIAIDGSKEMLQLLEKNIKDWFGDSIAFEGHVRDFTYEHFDDLLADDLVDESNATTIVFILGGTLSNFKYPERVLQSITGSLGLDDLLVYSGYLDTPNTRRYFDFDVSEGNNRKLDDQEKMILDYLNIDESLYDVEQLFNEKQRARTRSIRPRIDLSVKVKLTAGTRHVGLSKNEPVLLWRHKHYSMIEILNLFDKGGLHIMQATQSENQDYLLLISKVKTDAS